MAAAEQAGCLASVSCVRQAPSRWVTGDEDNWPAHHKASYVSILNPILKGLLSLSWVKGANSPFKKNDQSVAPLSDASLSLKT